MKVDIEKIKAEYEQKIQNAIEANQILDLIGDETFRVSISKSFTSKGKKTLRFYAEEVCGKLGIEKVGLVLSKLPVTEKISVPIENYNRIPMEYALKTNRGYKDNYATLSIRYIHNEYEVDLDLPIEPNKELNGYFSDGLRDVTESEITTYYIVSKPGRRAADVRIPIKLFANGDYVRFQGGHVTSKSEWAANNIIEAIKEAYTKSNESSNKI